MRRFLSIVYCLWSLSAISATQQPLFSAGGVFTTIQVSQIATWHLEEASGTRNDSEPTSPAHNLTDNNTVTQGTGKIGNDAVFTSANNESLTEGDTADISTGDIDFSCTGWVKFTTLTSSRQVVGHWGAAAGNRSWRFFYNSSANRLEFHISADGSTTALTRTAATFGIPSTATWYFFYVSHDSVGNLGKISINNGTVDSTSHTTGSFDATAEFSMGGFGSGGLWFDGELDEVRFFKKVLSAAEVSLLYNNGDGY